MVSCSWISNGEPSKVSEQRNTIMTWNNERLEKGTVQRSDGLDKRRGELEAEERLQERPSKDSSKGQREGVMDWIQ